MTRQRRGVRADIKNFFVEREPASGRQSALGLSWAGHNAYCQALQFDAHSPSLGISYRYNTQV